MLEDECDSEEGKVVAQSLPPSKCVVVGDENHATAGSAAIVFGINVSDIATTYD